MDRDKKMNDLVEFFKVLGEPGYNSGSIRRM